MGHHRGSNRMVGMIFTAMDIFLGGVGIVTLGAGRGGDHQYYAGDGDRTDEGDRAAEGAGRDNRSILSFSSFLRALRLTGAERGHRHCGAEAADVCHGAGMGNNRLRGFHPPRLVPWSAAMATGCAHGVWHRGGNLSGRQGGNVATRGSAAEGIEAM